MSDNLNDAIAECREALGRTPNRKPYMKAIVSADALAAVLDAIEGGEWEHSTDWSDPPRLHKRRRFVGAWKPVDPQ